MYTEKEEAKIRELRWGSLDPTSAPKRSCKEIAEIIGKGSYLNVSAVCQKHIRSFRNEIFIQNKAAFGLKIKLPKTLILKKSSQEKPGEDERLPSAEDIKVASLPAEIIKIPPEGTPIEKL